MKIIYCHHALRDCKNPSTQEDGIKKLGRADAKNVAKVLLLCKNEGLNIVCIYSSPFRRCMETAKIINKKLKLPIIEEPRFNEYDKILSVKNETWVSFQNRVRDGIKDIVYKFNENDAVLCITSGVNIAAFISLAYKLKTSKETPFIRVPGCSPLIFNINKADFEKQK